jgi:hypothetical protein
MNALTKAQFLQARCAEIQRDIDILKEEANKAAHIEDRIFVVGQYDRSVQKMISVHPDLAIEWQEFERVFESITGEQILRTASEKIQNRRDPDCSGCGRTLADRRRHIMERLGLDEK